VSELCQQGSNDDPDVTPSIADDNQEPGDTKTVGVGLFRCAKCSDRFDTFDEWQQHKTLHVEGKKKCKVCHKILAANTSMDVVSSCIITGSLYHLYRAMHPGKSWIFFRDFPRRGKSRKLNLKVPKSTEK